MASALVVYASVGMAYATEASKAEPVPSAVELFSKESGPGVPDELAKSVSAGSPNIRASDAIGSKFGVTANDLAVGYDASLHLDDAVYEPLLEDLKLSSEQHKLWQGVVLSYDLRAQSGGVSPNIVGTLALVKKEFELLKEKLKDFPPEVLADNEIRFKFILPRELTVVAFEKFYESLDAAQIEKFETYVYSLLNTQNSKEKNKTTQKLVP